MQISTDQIYQAKSRILKRLSALVADQIAEEGASRWSTSNSSLRGPGHPAGGTAPSAPGAGGAERALQGYADLVEIGRGGQGVVPSANQTSTGRRVAIKVLAGGAFADREHRLRFEREVHLLAGLAHDGIVRVHDSGVTAQPTSSW